MATQQQPQGIPLNEASQGGIPDDLDMEILDIVFCEYDYQGNIDHNILALGVSFQDDTGKTYDQYYSAGELTYFVPSDDGGMAVPVADKQRLTDTCNAWKFLASLLECGGDQMNELLGAGSVKPLAGMKVHVKQFAQPKRQGLIRGGKAGDREPTVLLVTSILTWPGQAAAQPKKTGLAGAGKPVASRPAPATTQKAVTGKPGLGGAAKQAAPAGKPNGQAGSSTVASGSDDAQKALGSEALVAILLEAGGNLPKKDLSKLAFQKAGQMVNDGQLDAKAKTRFVQMLFQDSYLHELATANVITFDGATVGLPG